MNIRQFEKLRGLVKEAADQILKLKLENKNLQKQLTELREKSQEGLGGTEAKELTGQIDRLKAENSVLREKHQVISTRLRKVLVKVKNLSEGVES
jgi:FtsZ-binding cell division protein ZapB